MNWVIARPAGPPSSGGEVCITVTGTPGSGPPSVTISFGDGPGAKATVKEIGHGIFEVCFVIPRGEADVRVSASGGGLGTDVVQL